MNQIPHGVSRGDELSSEFAEVIVSHLELLNRRHTALMTELNRTSLGDLVHIQSQVSEVPQLVRLDQHFETTIIDFVDSEVKDL